jgi:hypothetical protein
MIGSLSEQGVVRKGAVWTAAFAVVLLWSPVTVAYEWHIEAVDTLGDVGRDTSLRLDGSEWPHISYYDETNGDLKYAYLDASGWQMEVVDSAGNAGEYTSLVLDGDGYPHISYYGEDSLRLAHKNASGWHTEAVTAGGDYTSLALGAGGCAHISYCVDSCLCYAYKDASGWQVDTVDIGWAVHAHSTSLALDAGGKPHIAYGMYDSYWTGRVTYAYRDASGWHTEDVDGASAWLWSGSGGGAGISLALDGAGCPHVSYLSTPWQLRYAHRQGSVWQIEDTGYGDTYGGAWTSLALEGNGYPRILWNMHDYYAYVWQDASGWHIDGLPSAINCPYYDGYPSLALDGGGCPHVSCFCLVGCDLKYLRATIYLFGGVQAGHLVLTWTPWPGASSYWVYGADNEAYFSPGLVSPYQHRLTLLPPGTATWASPSGIGDPDHNWTYLVLAVDATGQELCRSNRVGEHDFGTGP